MNRLEFNEVMKAVGIDNPLLTTTGRYGSDEKVHFWQNVAINFGGSYYTVIHGKIPLEVANIIYEKYPNNPYAIRVDGGCDDWKPNEHATDDQYKKEIQEHIECHLDANEYLEKCKKSRRNMLRRKAENKYIDTYHIDTKEGLIILLTELKDYYARKQNLPATEAQRFEELNSTVSTEILKKVNPAISTYEWMNADEKNKKSFFETVLKGNSTSFGKMFRQALDGFDRTVNPYINSDIELDNVEGYLKKVNIKANTYDSVNGQYRQNCCEVEIIDIDSKNKVCYYRGPDSFSYQLHYVLGEKQYLTVLHYYSTSGENENEKGEEVYITYYGDNIPQAVDLRYNITHGVAGETYKEKTAITPEQMEFVYDTLLKATELASTITIDNMRKKVIQNN